MTRENINAIWRIIISLPCLIAILLMLDNHMITPNHGVIVAFLTGALINTLIRD